MDVDEPPQPLEPPRTPPPPEPRKRRCFCCGRRYRTRHLARHLRIFLDRLDQEIAAANAAEGPDNSDDPEDNNVGPVDVEMEVGDAAEGEDWMLNFGQDDADDLNGIDAGAGLLNVQPYVEPEHIHEPRQNPPVQIHEWPNPDHDSDCGSEGSSVDEVPGEGPDRDPPFEEFPGEPGDANLNILHEPDMMDEQVHAVMRLELGDLAEEEWLNLYDETLSNHDI
ncbi:hypothetical protein FRC07_013076, partial [Ceratobasidium sp. 392]